MIELDELEKNYAEFEGRKVRIIAVSNDDYPTAQGTQDKYRHIRIVSDPLQSVAKAMDVIHPGAAPGGADTNAPTTFLIDGHGYVRGVLRQDRFIARYSPAELLAEVDQALGPK